MTKSLANRLIMKQKLYSYRMMEDKSILEQLSDFNKTIDDLDNIDDAKLPDEDKAILLLNSLPKSYESIKDAMVFGGSGKITLERVQCAIRSKQLQKQTDGYHNQGLHIRHNKPKFQTQQQNKRKDLKGKLLEKGFIINMKKPYLTLKDARGNLIACVKMTKNRLFPLTLRHDTLKCMKGVIKDESWLWHLRFGHLNFEGLKLLSTKNMVKGLPHIDHPNEVCEGCILGKHQCTRMFVVH